MNLGKNLSDYFELQKQLNLFTNGLMVKELSKLPVNEMWCEREPTLEELAELWEIAKKECISCEGRQLKSGVIIFRKEEK